MPRCLMLTPFPLAAQGHGGQIRTAGLARALTHAGWRVETLGIYHADLFPSEPRGPDDIVIDDPAVSRRALADMLFADLHVARGAAADARVVQRLTATLARFQPDVIQIEHPWTWLVLRNAWPNSEGRRIVYSSHNLESRARQSLLDLNLDLRRTGTDALMQATRELEAEVACSADLVLSISDIEAATIAQVAGRDVVYVPPISDLAEAEPPTQTVYRQTAQDSRCRYAALMGSAYWPNREGFFASFPDGLGFLAQDERIWVAGSLGAAIRADPRFLDFQSVNDVRLRAWGHVADADKSAFFASAACVIIPVHVGAGAKQKTADALASGRPVITTSHALEGYGPLIDDVLERGVYVADTSAGFRGLIRRAMREGLPGCPYQLRERVSLTRMSDRLGPVYARMLAEPQRPNFITG